MLILVINSGSSSIKYQLIKVNSGELLVKGFIEKIGSTESIFNHSPRGQESIISRRKIKDHFTGLAAIVEALIDSEFGVIKDLGAIDAVGHRVVHGGERFTESEIITDEVITAINKCIELAPLHNPANIIGIEACQRLMPNTPQVAVFDTSFHQQMPPHSWLYAIPYEYYTKYGIRRYGFHGTSHKYVAQRAAEMLGRPLKGVKLITCHLGNGCSITAVKEGRSFDTSMGFTPLEGLVMGTRSGDLDPAVVLFLMDKEGLSIAEMNDILNKRSGLLGVSGLSNDIRDLKKAIEEGNERAKIAIDLFLHRVRKFIGSYLTTMNGLDAIVFTGGIGEKDAEIRSKICAGWKFLGIEIDEQINWATNGKAVDISVDSARVRVLVIPTDEELMIAIETCAVLKAIAKTRTD